MEKYIILLVILFLLLLYLNKNIEGIGEVIGEEGGEDRIKNYLEMNPGERTLTTADILPKDLSKKIFDKCNEAQQGYIPPKDPPIGPWIGNACLDKCGHPQPQEIDGNCGETLYKDESSTEDVPVNYKLCRKKCSSPPYNKAEDDRRRTTGGIKVRKDCTNNNECDACYKDISYNIATPVDPEVFKDFRCGVKVMCPNSKANDGCGGYASIGQVDAAAGTGQGSPAPGSPTAGAAGAAGGAGAGAGAGAAGAAGAGAAGAAGAGAGAAADDARIARIAAAAAIILKDDPFTSSNETVDCSTYPKHPKCGHTHKPQMFGCINNAKEGEINSISKPGTLDSSWGLFK